MATKCARCFQVIDETSTFCPACGRRLRREKRKGRWLGEMDAVRWIGTVLILFLGLSFLVGMCQYYSDPKNTPSASDE